MNRETIEDILLEVLSNAKYYRRDLITGDVDPGDWRLTGHGKDLAELLHKEFEGELFISNKEAFDAGRKHEENINQRHCKR